MNKKIINNIIFIVLIIATLVVGYFLTKKSPTAFSKTVALQKVKEEPILATNGSSGSIGGSFEVNQDNFQKITKGDTSYYRVFVEERQIYCAAKGAQLSGKGKTKEEIKKIAEDWNNKTTQCGETTGIPAEKDRKSRPYYELKETKQATPAEAFMLTYPSPDWNSWSEIKQEAIWANARLNRNKKAPKTTGNTLTARRLALQAAAYEEFANKINSSENKGTLNPKNTTNEDKVRVLVNQNKKEYKIGPFSMKYVGANYGMVFGGISDMYVVSKDNKKIKIESFIVKDENGKYTKEITPRYFTPIDDKNLVDTGEQNYPKSEEKFYIKIKATEDLHVKNVHVEFKWLKAEATLYYFQCYKYYADFSHSHTYHCHGGHIDANGNKYNCAGCCFNCTITTAFNKKSIAYQDLVESEGKRWLEETSLDMKIPPEKPKNLTIKLAGNVWEDEKDKKETKMNGKKDEEEKLLPGIEVVLYRADNNQKIATTITDKNGHYEFNEIDSKYKYYIEFIYNAQIYEPTTYNTSISDEERLSGGYSNATDIIAQREEYNKNFYNIGSYPENYKVRRNLYYKVGEYNIAYNIQKYSNASGNTYTTDEYQKSEYGIKEIYEYVVEQATETKSYEKAYKNALNKFGNNETTKRKLQFIEDCRFSSFTGNNTQIKVYPIYDKYTIGYEARTVKGVVHPALYPKHLQIDFGLTKREKANISVVSEVLKANIEIKGRTETYYYRERTPEEKLQDQENSMWNIKTRLSDVAYYSTNYSREIYKSDYLYRVENYGNNLTQEQIKEKYGQTQEGELEVYITYKIMICNNSQLIKMRLDEIVDYYDAEYEYVPDRSYIAIPIGENKGRYEIKAKEGESKYSNKTKSAINGYNNLYITGLEETFLSQGQIANMYLTFKVKKDANRFIYLDENNAAKQNITEINGYSTVYTKGTEIPNVGTVEEENKIAGILDASSVPGNVVEPIDETHFEDDTDKAIPLSVILDNDNRTIEGIAWEDERTNYNKTQATTTGNGIKEEKEEAIDGIRVQLVELLDNGEEYIWKEFKTGSGSYDPIINAENRIQTIQDSTKGKYIFTSFVPGNYIVRFIYGDNDETVLTSLQTEVTNLLQANGKNEKSYNGQDYKSTIYEPEIEQNRTYYSKYLQKEITGFKDYENQNATGTYLYDITALEGKNISTAKDIQARREETIKYSSENVTNEIAELLVSYKNVPEGTTKEALRAQIEEFKQKTAMTAETGNINIEIEKDTSEVTNQAQNNNIKYNLSNVNLGLEERAKAQIAVSKEVANTKVVLADNTVLFDASKTAKNVLWINNAKYEPVYKNGILEAIKNSNAQQKGLVQLSMDEELMHGATIQITYKITASNIGETDYNDSQYYYTGVTSNVDKVATTTANQVIDYVANNLKFDASQNKNWKAISPEEIASQKLVNARLQDKLQAYNTIVTTTNESSLAQALVPEIYQKAQNKGSSSAEEILYLTQSITSENETEDLTYNNIVEIVKISNTVGRKNEYSIVGNQDPTKKPAEVDSSSAETVKILPPFGAQNIAIIAITITASVAILVAGIVLIKKKVLN